MKKFIFKNFGFDIQKNINYTKMYNKHFENYTSQNKPCGLWGSPIDAKYSWEEWCKEENFETNSLKIENLVCADTSNCLFIKSKKDLHKLDQFLIKTEYRNGTKYLGFNIDWKKIMSLYDGIILYRESYCRTWDDHDMTKYGLSCWDVDSVCLWNLNKILWIKNKKRKSFRH